jgi:hypothetical protein
MVRAAALMCVSMLAFPASAAGPTGYKLVLVVNDKPVLVDYPSLDRCRYAQNFAEAEARRRYEDAASHQPPGSILAKPAFTVSAFCLPN